MYEGRSQILQERARVRVEEDVEEAWYLLMQTPRHYWDETTLTDWSGQKSVPCPCAQKPFS
jgi:hypothetical protein